MKPSTDREQLHFLIGAMLGVMYANADAGLLTYPHAAIGFVIGSLMCFATFWVCNRVNRVMRNRFGWPE